MNNNISGGGFIVVDLGSWLKFLHDPEFDSSRIKILLLELDSGVADLPKGRQDAGESILACALRELEEETSIGLEDIKVLNFRSKHNELTMFACSVSRDVSIDLPINPKLGHPEHWEYWWSQLKYAANRLPKYLTRFLVDFEKFAIRAKILANE